MQRQGNLVLAIRDTSQILSCDVNFFFSTLIFFFHLTFILSGIIPSYILYSHGRGRYYSLTPFNPSIRLNLRGSQVKDVTLPRLCTYDVERVSTAPFGASRRGEPFFNNRSSLAIINILQTDEVFDEFCVPCISKY